MTRHRVYMRGRRIHHGLVGLIAAMSGVLAMWHDRRDFPWLADN